MINVCFVYSSKCQISEKFYGQVLKSGIVENVLTWAKFKAESVLDKKQSGKKTNKLKGIPKLEDANDAGGRNSLDCTLILTEGDSAKTLAVAGLGVVGRDRYGVFPLRGKLLNVREATHKQVIIQLTKTSMDNNPHSFVKRQFHFILFSFYCRFSRMLKSMPSSKSLDSSTNKNMNPLTT